MKYRIGDRWVYVGNNRGLFWKEYTLVKIKEKGRSPYVVRFIDVSGIHGETCLDDDDMEEDSNWELDISSRVLRILDEL